MAIWRGGGQGHGIGGGNGDGGREGARGSASERRASTSRGGSVLHAHTYISIAMAHCRGASVRVLGLTSPGGGEIGLSARLAYCLRV